MNCRTQRPGPSGWHLRRQLLLGAMCAGLCRTAASQTPTPGGTAATPRAPRLPIPPDPALAEARLTGHGRFRWFGLAIYDAELLAKNPVSHQDWFNQTFALRLTYARAFRGAEIAQSSIEEIDKLGLATELQRDSWLRKMTAVFPDVPSGDDLTGVHLPGTGVRFWNGQRLLGEVADPIFARAFFAIWLDPKTTAPDLRRKLLGA